MNRILQNDIFISYRRDGGHVFANMIYDYLKAMGYRPYMDKNIRAGATFPRELENAIDESHYFLLLLTPKWCERCRNSDDWIRQEVFHAVRQKKPIIQFASSDCPDPHPADLITELEFLRWQHFEQYSPKHHDSSFKNLLRSFRTLRFKYRMYLLALMVGCMAGGLITGLFALYAPSLTLCLAAGVVGCFIGYLSSTSSADPHFPSAIENPIPPEPNVRPPDVVVDFFPKSEPPK